MSIFSMIEDAKLISAWAPLDITGAGVDGDLVNMENCERLWIVLIQGAWAGGASGITVTQETSASGSANTAVAFTKKYTATALTDDVFAEVAVTSDTFDIDTANEIHIIEIRPEILAVGSTHVRVRCDSPGANADLLAGLYIQSGLKYHGDPANIPTAIT